MADLLLERVTGRSTTESGAVEVSVVISDASLVGAGAEPALVGADGTASQAVPAQVARELVARASEADAAFVRRLYARPDGELVAMTSRQRFARGALADFLAARDQGTCRTPWCDAPARHVDHVVAVADGGVTTAHDTQQLCVACNHAKQAPGWSARPLSHLGRHVVETTTPTGARHRSQAPRPPSPATPPRTALDAALDRIAARVGADQAACHGPSTPR